MARAGAASDAPYCAKLSRFAPTRLQPCIVDPSTGQANWPGQNYTTLQCGSTRTVRCCNADWNGGMDPIVVLVLALCVLGLLAVH
jgi:hypothetical protein